MLTNLEGMKKGIRCVLDKVYKVGGMDEKVG